MTFDQIIVLFTIGVAIILFSFEWLPADVIALGVLLFLTITRVLPPEQAFSGFGSDSVILILGLLILTAGLNRTGVVEIIGKFLVRFSGRDHQTLIIAIMVTALLIGSFISNTASTAILIPVSIGLARHARLSTSKVLMPLAFASILSSSVTLISTTTNIVVSGIMTQHQLPPLSMFELTPVGIPVAVVGLLYMAFIGVRLIPQRNPAEEKFEEIGVLPYFTEVIILPNSPLINSTLEESRLGRDLDLTVVRIARKNSRYLQPKANDRLKEGDVLLVEGGRDDIIKIKDQTGIGLKVDDKFSEVNKDAVDIQMVEAIVLLRSPLVGRTLEGARFRERYGLQVLAINRHGETIRRKISQVVIRLGDVLLIQGDRNSISALETDKAYRIIGEISNPIPNTKRALIAVLAFGLSLGLASINLISLPVAVMGGVMVLFLTRSITPEEAYRDVEWKAVILIACLLGVGTALVSTGTADYLAGRIVVWFGNSNPRWLLAGFFLLSTLLTQPMSNQAAAAVVVPLAIQTATHLGLNPRTFAVMIAVGASCSFLTPLEPSCLMIYGLGRYRFFDFVKVGFLLTILIFILAILLVPVFWPV